MTDVSQAISILQRGGLIGLPTETVYGLAGDASNETAIRQIFAAKSRPADHPLIVHIGDIALLTDWATDISDDAMRLARAFWPGPLTLILKKAQHVSNLLTGNQETIGIRIPNHPIALTLLKKFNGGLAAPSANKFGRISPTTADAVRDELGDALELVLDGGPCDVGVESTIVDVTSETPVILRPGMISAEEIEKIINKKLTLPAVRTIRVSGSCELHYAPVTPTYVLSLENIQQKISMSAKVGVIARSVVDGSVSGRWLTLSSNAKEYAHDLYSAMRQLDSEQLDKILIEDVPNAMEWDAIRDRLHRAKHN